MHILKSATLTGIHAGEKFKRTQSAPALALRGEKGPPPAPVLLFSSVLRSVFNIAKPT